MKTRRHHNNTGLRQIKRGKTRTQVAKIAKRLGIKHGIMVCPDFFMSDRHKVDECEACRELNK